jgi:hypothetical protein
MLFNNKKTDGMVTYQSNGKTLEMTDNMKILGFQFQSDMKVSGQVQNMLIKSNKKIWGLRNLIYNGGTRENGKQFYVTWILSLFEYAVPVWHGRLTSGCGRWVWQGVCQFSNFQKSQKSQKSQKTKQKISGCGRGCVNFSKFQNFQKSQKSQTKKKTKKNQGVCQVGSKRRETT